MWTVSGKSISLFAKASQASWTCCQYPNIVTYIVVGLISREPSISLPSAECSQLFEAELPDSSREWLWGNYHLQLEQVIAGVARATLHALTGRLERESPHAKTSFVALALYIRI